MAFSIWNVTTFILLDICDINEFLRYCQESVLLTLDNQNQISSSF